MFSVFLFPVLVAVAPGAAYAASKPNILFIMPDDIGIFNIGVYRRGLMVGETPNIDRIAKEGALFTDYYGEQSCTAGRTAFVTGMHPMRAGMLMPQLPGANGGTETAISDLNVFAAYLFDTGDPAISFGLGPQLTAPTATNDDLGSEIGGKT